MIRWILPEKGTFYKANLHCHSTDSDGKFTPEQLVEGYRSHGYSVLAITDHDRMGDRRSLNRDDFLVLHGYEYSHCSAQMRGRTVHLGMIARDPETVTAPPRILFEAGKEGMNEDSGFSASLNQVIARARTEGFLPVYNHMRWSLESEADLLSYEGLFGMEVFNYFSEILGVDEDNMAPWLTALRRGKRLFALMADDNHNLCRAPSLCLNEIDPWDCSFGGWVCIKAQSLTYEHIISALERGDFYASSGPAFESLYVEDNVLKIRSSPVCSVGVNTANRKAFSHWSKTERFTSAEFPLRGDEEFLVVTLTDERGRRAVSQPYFL